MFVCIKWYTIRGWLWVYENSFLNEGDFSGGEEKKIQLTRI